MAFDPTAQRRFLVCLAEVLRNETGYVQPVGGPYRRHADGSSRVPSRPDGAWFDDDPDDSGGRTAAGILQREYDAWRRASGYSTRDVWLMEDSELTDIYRRQYWQSAFGDELPAGVDYAVFDMGVLCGVGRGIKALQAALGVSPDGQFGMAVRAALANADPGDVIEAVCRERRAYLRRCPTFWKFGKGWLARVDEVEARARVLAYNVPQTAEAALADADTPPPSRKARLPEPPSSMAGSSTGNTALALGGTSGVSIATEMPQAVSRAASGPYGLTLAGILFALASSPTFWFAAFALASAAYVWFERRRRLIMHGV